MYKTIYINTISLLIIDIKDQNNINLLFKYDGFQLWEQKICGFINTQQKDIITVSSAGVQAISLNKIGKRAVINNKEESLMMHSLESFNFLKNESCNFLLYDCTKDVETIISV